MMTVVSTHEKYKCVLNYETPHFCISAGHRDRMLSDLIFYVIVEIEVLFNEVE